MPFPFTATELVTADNLNKAISSVCQVHDAAQSLTDETATTIIFDSDEQLDPRGWHDNSTNPSQVKPNIAGWYRVIGWSALVSSASTVTRMQISVAKSASTVFTQNFWPGAVNTIHEVSLVTPLISMNGSSDYFELRVYQNDSGGTTRAVESYMCVELVYAT